MINKKSSSNDLINNFDLLRFIFASIVFFVHSRALSLTPELEYTQYLSSSMAVKSFFIVSGFLIFMSYEGSSNLTQYISKRIRRIYPGYLFVILSCAFLGVLFSSLDFRDYFTVDWLKYVFFNTLFLNFLKPDLPGLFQDNILSAVNGALWTLKIEVMFYISVPLIVIAIKKYGVPPIFISLYFLSLSYQFLINLWGGSLAAELGRQLPGQLVYFISWAAIYYYKDLFKKYYLFLLTFASLFFLIPSFSYMSFFEPIALAIIILYFSLIFPYLGNFTKYGDFSYGIYILHFPILQALVQLGLFNSNPYLAFCLALILVLVGAFLLWHLVEKHFLQKSSHYLAKMK
jgi:peptidoglycan/LPS O-acetylase OafA/YrhL